MYALNCLKNTGSRNVHAVCVLLLLLSSPLVATADLVFHLPCEDAVNPMDVSVDPTPIVVHGQLNVVDAKIGSGLEFNGIDGDRLEVVDADKLDGMSAITIALWFLPRNPADYGLLTKRNNTNNEESYSIFSWMNPTQNIYFRINGNQGGEFISSTIPEHNMWYHIACVFDGQEAGDNMRLYLNGVLDASQNNPATTVNSGTPPVTIGALIPAKWPLDGVIDDVMIFNHALTQDDIQQVMAGTSPGLASNASPADEASDVLRDVILSWEPGEFAPAGNGHIVYFSESFNDVNDGIGGVTQSAASYTPAQRLEFGTTYYWRIDEVNAAPDNTIFKGEVWSFEVEPLSIPIENITATASAANPGMEASKTIDGSGLNEMDQHSILSADMWQATGVADTWIQYDFDKAYKLYEMLVWNSNTNIEPFLGFGAKEITIETSTDGTTWTALAGVHQLAQGTGLADYTANTSVDFGGAVAKYVKLTMVSAHGLTGQIGLSEVRFLAIPTLAREPQPTSGAAVNSADIMLSWRAGREAVEHKVLLGTDAGNLSLLGTVTDNQIDSGALAYATTYYWSVTEVNQAETPTEHVGEVWSFTTPDYGVVDDFESYSGEEGEEIFMTWFDGYAGDASLGGSTTGHINGPFVETTIVKGGRQSMPVYIDNDGDFFDIDSKMSSPTFSEVVRDLGSQDWTASGVKTLSIMFSGSTGLTGQLYCKIGNTKLLYDGAASSIGSSAWQAWNIDLSTVGGNLQSVRELAIGVEGGTSGILYIDDIRLYPLTGEVIIPVMPDTANLAAYYPLDGDYQDASGNNRHGTPVAPAEGPIFEPGMTGQALTLNVVGQYVEITGYQGIVADRSDPDNPVQQPFTVACWINTTTAAGALVTWGSSDGGPVGGQYQSLRIEGGSLRAEHGNGNYRGATPVDDGEWHHIALTVAKGANLRVPQNQLFVDGQEDSFRAGGSDNVYNITADADVSIGQRASHGDRFFTGSIDEVRIYDRALSLAEIAGLAGRTGLIHKPL